MTKPDRLPKPQTPQQLQFVFSDIAEAASAIRRFALALTERDETDERDVEAYRRGIECLAERVGLLADWAGAPMGPMCPVVGGSLEDWMMPPAWHPEAAEQEADHAR